MPEQTLADNSGRLNQLKVQEGRAPLSILLPAVAEVPSPLMAEQIVALTQKLSEIHQRVIYHQRRR